MPLQVWACLLKENTLWWALNAQESVGLIVHALLSSA